MRFGIRAFSHSYNSGAVEEHEEAMSNVESQRLDRRDEVRMQIRVQESGTGFWMKRMGRTSPNGGTMRRRVKVKTLPI